jgi:hypothetical protein
MAALSLSGMLSFGETSNLMVCRQDQVSHVQIYTITVVIFTAENRMMDNFQNVLGLVL